MTTSDISPELWGQMWALLEDMRADVKLERAVSPPACANALSLRCWRFEDDALGSVHAAFDDDGLVVFEWSRPLSGCSWFLGACSCRSAYP